MITNEEYYLTDSNHRFILFNMLNSVNLKDREVIVFSKKRMTRGLFAYHTSNLEYLISKWKPAAMFHSVAISDGRQFEHRTVLDTIKNAAESRKSFFEAFNENLRGYDWIIDIDARRWDDAYTDARKIYDFFNEVQFPFSVNFSGGKGFHFRISWDAIRDEMHSKLLPNELNSYPDSSYVKRVPEELKHLTETLVRRLKLKFVDTGVYQQQRIFRVPYSVHQNGEFVCLPLCDEQFEDFNVSMCTKEATLSLRLKDRRLLTRDGVFSLKVLK